MRRRGYRKRGQRLCAVWQHPSHKTGIGSCVVALRYGDKPVQISFCGRLAISAEFLSAKVSEKPLEALGYVTNAVDGHHLVPSIHKLPVSVEHLLQHRRSEV